MKHSDSIRITSSTDGIPPFRAEYQRELWRNRGNSERCAEFTFGAVLQTISNDYYRSDFNFINRGDTSQLIDTYYTHNLYERVINSSSQDEAMKIYDEIMDIVLFDPYSSSGLLILNAYLDLVNLCKLIKFKFPTIHSEYPPPTIVYAITKDYLTRDIHTVISTIIIGESIPNLSRNQINLIVGDSLIINWSNFCNREGKKVCILTNPPYKGAHKRDSEETAKVESLFGYKEADYSACWFLKSSEYISKNNGSRALTVTTNSIVQGSNVKVWDKILTNEICIDYAKSSFKWMSNIKNKTGVTLVAIGLAKETNQKKVFEYSGGTALLDSIGVYAIAANMPTSASNLILEKRSSPISDLPPMRKGNMPYDGGNLILSKDEKNELLSKYPLAKKYLKKLIGSEELVNGTSRWCLWISDEDYEFAKSIPPILHRIQKTQEYRASNTDKTVQKIAKTPYRFRDIIETHSASVVMPAVSSEKRPYYQVDFIGPNTIVTNLALVCYDCEPWVFGILSSKMHHVWCEIVCGKHETRSRYSLIGYNNFPIPKLSKDDKEQLTNLSLDIIRIRESMPELTLAQIYNNIPENLQLAHQHLDQYVEGVYRKEPFESDNERFEFMVSLYNQLVKENE